MALGENEKLVSLGDWASYMGTILFQFIGEEYSANFLVKHKDFGGFFAS